MDSSLYLEKLAENPSWCKSGFEGLCLDVIDKYWWGICIEVVIFFLMFAVIGNLCDEFLVPCLEILCVKLNLKEDVAGASFLAFGASAPEIVISTITTIQGGENVDVGIGSIVGSGMIGLLLIPGICGMSTKRDLELKRRPLSRDVIFYILCIIGLVAFLNDGTIYALESIYLLCIYIAYILILIFAPMVRRSYRIRKNLIDPNITTSFISNEGLDSDEERVYEPIDSKPDQDDIAIEEAFNPIDANTEASSSRKFLITLRNFINNITNCYEHYIEEPISWFFKHVIPKCVHGTESESLYPVTFIVSIFWIAVTTFVMSAVCQRWVEIIENLGFISFFICNIAEGIGSLIGMVVVSFGASIADMMQCITVSKKGYGSMAIGNTVGSQILNICVGLGLPWLIRSLIEGHGVHIPGNKLVAKAGFLLAIGSLVLISITLGPALIFKEDKCKLGNGKGLIMVCMYVVVIVFYSIISFTSGSE